MKPILRTRYLILRQCSNLNGQASTFFSSNGCKVDINYLLLFSDSYIFKIYSRAFLSDYKTLFCSCMSYLHLKPHIYSFFYLSKTVWGKSKPIPKTFTFWSSNVRDGRISLFKGPRHNLKSIFFSIFILYD